MIKKILSQYRLYFWSHHKYAKYIGVKFGKGCRIRTRSFGSEPYLISIGDHVQITDGVKIFTHGGGWVFRDKYPKLDFFGKVIIRDNVYIGNNCLIMPGVTIGKNVIVGAGSVVSKSIADGKVVAGNPARVICDTDEFFTKIESYDVSSNGMNYADKMAYLLSLSEDRFIKK